MVEGKQQPADRTKHILENGNKTKRYVYKKDTLRPSYHVVLSIMYNFKTCLFKHRIRIPRHIRRDVIVKKLELAYEIFKKKLTKNKVKSEHYKSNKLNATIYEFRGTVYRVIRVTLHSTPPALPQTNQ